MELFNAIHSQQHSQSVSQSKTNISQKKVSDTHKTSQQINEKETNRIEQKGDKAKLKKQLQEVTDRLNKEMDPLNTTIRFGFNDKIDEMYVSVINTSNNNVIRKIPSEEAMQLAAKMRELVGMIFDKKG